MSFFNELALAFKPDINNLFISYGFECRKLFYGGEIFYCVIDILKCLGYSEYKAVLKKTLKKNISKNNRFTIKQLQEKYKTCSCFSGKNDINNDLISSQDEDELEYIYTNKLGLCRITGSPNNLEVGSFRYFVYIVLLPTLDNKYKEMLKKKIINSMN